VQVHLGPFPNNREPLLLSLEGGTAAQARREITFSALATDADGDTLAYRWDSGDGSVSGGTGAAAASFTHAWITEGTYTVSVTVSDMKGGSASRSVAVKVKDPARDFAKRTSGTDSEFLETREPGVAGPMGAGARGGEVLFVENTWPDYLGQFALVGRGNFRIATSVPSSGTFVVFSTLFAVVGMRRRRY
jgi:PKD repeat protein